MLHYDIKEDAAVVTANHKTTFGEIWETASAVLTLILGSTALMALCTLIPRM